MPDRVLILFYIIFVSQKNVTALNIFLLRGNVTVKVRVLNNVIKKEQTQLHM